MVLPPMDTRRRGGLHFCAMKEHRIVAVNLRMPSELHADLQRVAKEQDRSVTAQINRFLREAVDRYRREHPEWQPERETER
jgi:hypothetical protein